VFNYPIPVSAPFSGNFGRCRLSGLLCYYFAGKRALHLLDVQVESARLHALEGTTAPAVEMNRAEGGFRLTSGRRQGCGLHRSGALRGLFDQQIKNEVDGNPVDLGGGKLEKLRCNLYGAVFTADPPGNTCTEKYDESAAAMIAVLKYGSGFPFHRIEKLQERLGIPLPAATQWDILEKRAEEP
jgi:hypothetical protein